MKVKRSHFKVMAAQGGTSGSYAIIGWNGDKDQEVAGSNNPTSLQSIFNEAEKIGKSGKYSDIEIHISFKQGVKSSAYAVKRPIRAARTETIQYLNFDELSEEQKQKAARDFASSETAYRWYSEEMSDVWSEQSKIDADEFTQATGISVNSKKLHWEESSQGPYPKWNLGDVLGDYEAIPGVSASFYGSLTAKFDTIWVEEQGDFIATGYQDYGDTNELRKAGLNDIADQLDAILAKVQEFVDKIWELVEMICTSYPDEEWAYETLEANNYEFRVDGNGNVISMA